MHVRLGMNEKKWQWWMGVALVIGSAYLAFAAGNLSSSWWDEEASLASAVISATGGLAMAALAVGGVLLRRRGNRLGSIGVAISALPASGALMFWWFPPAILAGALAIAVVVFALADAFAVSWAPSRH